MIEMWGPGGTVFEDETGHFVYKNFSWKGTNIQKLLHQYKILMTKIELVQPGSTILLKKSPEVASVNELEGGFGLQPQPAIPEGFNNPNTAWQQLQPEVVPANLNFELRVKLAVVPNLPHEVWEQMGAFHNMPIAVA